jgi:tRNA nucleotidyltransferase (CCA-adding enzyme)
MELEQFVHKLISIGAKGYLVGGAVRDLLLNKESKDRDYCVTAITQEGFMRLFPEAVIQGKDFPVFRMEIDGEMCEVALARLERKTKEGHTGFEIYTNEFIMIEEDLARRDLTINAMAIDLETHELIDPFNGELDIMHKMIRATTDAFAEDPLRVYRAARFAAQFDFTIDIETMEMMKQLKYELFTLSIERVMEETKKALLSNTPSRFFYYLQRIGVLDVHFPEIDVLTNYHQHPVHHPEGTVFEHTMQVIDAARYFSRDLPADRALIVMFSALLHDVGKAVTFKLHETRKTPTFIGHEHDGVPITEAFLDRFNLQSMKKAVLFGVEQHMFMHDSFTATRVSKAVDFVEGKFELGQEGYFRKPGIVTTMGVDEYNALCLADTVGRLSYPHNIKQILPIVSEVIESFNQMRPFKLEDLKKKIVEIKDEETANKLGADIIKAISHKWILEKYHAEHVTCSLDIKELKTRYAGKNLGYQIHSDKRKQRMALMKHFRSIMQGYIETLG